MNLILKFIRGREEDVLKQSVFWNMVSSIAYSFQSAILMLVVTRIGGLAAAGVFSIAYSTSQMFSSIGSYSMRTYQVSDTRNRFSFETYFTSRCLTVAVMLAVCFSYSLTQGYAGEKLLALTILSFYRATDGMIDVFLGEYQKRGRLDIGCRTNSTRIIVASVAFILAYCITRNVVAASLTMMLMSVLVAVVLVRALNRDFCITPRANFHGLRQLLIACLPVCLGAFLYSYLGNSPKNAVDAALGSEDVAVFNILFMPVFVSAMLSNFAFSPFVYPMGEAWNNGEKRKFLKMIGKLLAVIVALSALVVLGGAFVGLPLLSLIYGVELSSYRTVFVLLLTFGGFAALNNFGTAILTVIRRQGFILAAYIVAFVLDLFFMDALVGRYAIMGAGLAYGMVMAVIFLCYAGVILWSLMQSKPVN